jgi:hypothetical protein
MATRRQDDQFDAVKALVWFAVGTVVALAIIVLLGGVTGGWLALPTVPVVHEPF